MIVTTTITKGAGSVSGSGTFDENDSITLTATPVDSNTFKAFVIGAETFSQNPYTFTAGLADVSVDVEFYTTIEDYLLGSVPFSVASSALNNIRVTRGIAYGADVATLSTKTIQLAVADVLMWGATSYTSWSGQKDSDGGWSHTEGSFTLSADDKASMRSRAMQIYKLYGDAASSPSLRVEPIFGEPYYVR